MALGQSLYLSEYEVFSPANEDTNSRMLENSEKPAITHSNPHAGRDHCFFFL